tara:strand:- start:934 stop:1152 length:219 start_codon:yes stop_codon:yes gene_type:complete
MSQENIPSIKKGETEVLFQKLGGKWYVFSQIEEEFIYSPLPKGIDPRSTRLELFNIIEEHINRVAGYYKETA